MDASETRGRGRPRSVTRDEVARVALSRFIERGFEQTTMDDIAAELGIARRTVFRYYPSKNDLVWGEFGEVLERIRAELFAADPGLPIMTVVREAAVRSNAYPDEQLGELRDRMTLIQTVPALQAHSMLRYAEWRAVIALYAAQRLGCGSDALMPIALGHAALAASSAAFSRWVTNPDEDILELLNASYRLLEQGFRPDAPR